jgi:membrane protein YqaA with SNARE-associated domain
LTVHQAIADVGSPEALSRPNWATHLVGGVRVGLAFLWRLGESTLFLVVPDAVVSLVSMLENRRAWRHIAAAVAGAVLGGA